MACLEGARRLLQVTAAIPAAISSTISIVLIILHLRRRRAFGFLGLEPETGYGRRLTTATTQQAESGMTIERALVFSILMSVLIATAGRAPALAQACTREGANVSCDDGRRGLRAGDAP